MWPFKDKVDEAIQKILNPMIEMEKVMETPDVTKNQLIALGIAIINTLVAFGITLTEQQQHAMLGLYVVCVGLLWADKGIRRGRAEVEVAAQYSTTKENSDA